MEDVRYKTVLCHNWTGTAGSCVRGERCAFAHGEGELRKLPRAAAMNALGESGGTMLVSQLFAQIYADCNKDAAKAEIKAAGYVEDLRSAGFSFEEVIQTVPCLRPTPDVQNNHACVARP